jgi:hypothetical protein
VTRLFALAVFNGDDVCYQTTEISNKALVLGATALALSAGATSAQGANYVYRYAPYGYGYAPTTPLYDYAAPAYGYARLGFTATKPRKRVQTGQQQPRQPQR